VGYKDEVPQYDEGKSLGSILEEALKKKKLAADKANSLESDYKPSPSMGLHKFHKNSYAG
jgi:hypothetical protein